MKQLVFITLFALMASPAFAVCTQHGTVGASSTQVVAKGDLSPGRLYIFIQNTGITNGMNVAIGSSNAATTSDVYLGPGQSWVMIAPTLSTFATPNLPTGDISVIQNGGSTTYAFCDF